MSKNLFELDIIVIDVQSRGISEKDSNLLDIKFLLQI